MIKIVKDSSNVVALTLTEKRTSTSETTYLLKLTERDTSTSSYCICTDSSSYTERYNKLTIVETSSPTPEDGEVELNSGFYDYTVYDNVNSATNLDPTGLLEVENGILKAIGTAIVTTTYSGGNSTYVVYGES